MDLNLIDNKHNNLNIIWPCAGETIAQIAYGYANNYLEKFNNDIHTPFDKKYGNNVYMPKNRQGKYLLNMEHINLERDLINDEIKLKKELEESNRNYVSRLQYSLEANTAEIDLCCENITWSEVVWNGKRKTVFIDKNNFSLYDVYLKIEKTNGEITKDDMIKFIYVDVNIFIDKHKLLEKNIFTMFLFELMDGQEIQLETNILYCKAFNFENMKYGLFSKFGDIEIDIFGITIIHKNFKIELVLSGKNMYGMNIDLNNDKFSQIVISSYVDLCMQKISSGQKSDNLNHLKNISSALIFIFDDPEKDYIDVELETIFLYLNNAEMWWDVSELIKINFLDIPIFILCFDPLLKDYNNFVSYLNNNPDLSTLKSINFDRIDTIKLKFEYLGIDEYLVHTIGLHLDKLTIDKNNNISIGF